MVLHTTSKNSHSFRGLLETILHREPAGSIPVMERSPAMLNPVLPEAHSNDVLVMMCWSRVIESHSPPALPDMPHRQSSYLQTSLMTARTLKNELLSIPDCRQFCSCQSLKAPHSSTAFNEQAATGSISGTYKHQNSTNPNRV